MYTAVSPSPASVFRMICALVGVDPALMATCPPRDRDGVRLLCALMMLVWLWQSAIFAAVAHLMLALPGERRPDLIAGAGLLATIILLLDAYVVMRPSWTGFGHEELRRGGFVIRLPVSVRVKGGLFLTLRLALSAVIGTLVALFVSLILYGKDIGGQLAAEHATRNAPVIAAAARRVDDRIARNAGSQVDLRARIAAADRAAEGLRRGLAERVDPAIAGAVAELARAEQTLQHAEAEVARLRRRVDVPGLARAQRRLDAATAGRDATRARLTYAESRALPLAQGRDTVLIGELAALNAQRQQDLNRLAAVEAEQRTMVDGRTAALRSEVMADPAYMAPDDGLLARLHALRTLTADPWVGAVALLLEVFFAGIELAAVFAKLLSFVPTTYATRLAREDQLRQVATSREIAAALEGPGEPTARSAVSDQGDVPGTLTVAGAPIDGPSGMMAANEPDLIASPLAYTAPDRRPPDPGSVQARLESSQGPSTGMRAPIIEPPRRKRGRPPKTRS